MVWSKRRRKGPGVEFKVRGTGHVNFHVNSKCNFSKHMSRPAFTRTSNEELQISGKIKLSGPKRSIKITDHFTCTSSNVIYCITCTLCKKFYIGETGRRLGDRFREHLRDVEKDDKNASKPVARQFKMPNHSKQHMIVCGLSLQQGSTESRKTLEQQFIFQIGTLNPHDINERFSFN